MCFLVSLPFRFRDCMMQPSSYDDPSWELFTVLVLLHSSHFSFLFFSCSCSSSSPPRLLHVIHFSRFCVWVLFFHFSLSFISCSFCSHCFRLLCSSLLFSAPIFWWSIWEGTRLKKEQENTEKEEQPLEEPSQVAFCEREYNSIRDREMKETKSLGEQVKSEERGVKKTTKREREKERQKEERQKSKKQKEHTHSKERGNESKGNKRRWRLGKEKRPTEGEEQKLNQRRQETRMATKMRDKTSTRERRWGSKRKNQEKNQKDEAKENQ